MQYCSSVYSFDIMKDQEGRYWIYRYDRPVEGEPPFPSELSARWRAWELI